MNRDLREVLGVSRVWGPEGEAEGQQWNGVLREGPEASREQ